MDVHDLHFAERAQVAIDFRGLSGPELRAAMKGVGLDLSKNHFYRLLRGEISDPHYSTVAAIIAATRVPSNWFFDSRISPTSMTLVGLTNYLNRQARLRVGESDIADGEGDD